MARSGEWLVETCSLATAPAPAADDLPACPRRPGVPRLGGPADLAHQQLIRCNQRERRPRCDDATSCRWLGDRDIGSQARRAARHQQSPRQEPARPPLRESASSVVDAATIIPSTDSGVSAATQPGCPCSSTSRCMCRYETVPAISASIPRHPDVVRLIHQSTRPFTTALPAAAHQ